MNNKCHLLEANHYVDYQGDIDHYMLEEVSLTQNPGSWILDPAPRVLDPRSRMILDPGSRILDPVSWIQAAGSWIRVDL